MHLLEKFNVPKCDARRWRQLFRHFPFFLFSNFLIIIFIVFFFVQYLSSIPDELIEAARIDGAKEFVIYWRIILPLLKPAIIAMMILTAIGEWNNFLWPLIITESESMANLPVAIALLKNSGAGNIGSQGPLMAFALLISLPTILLYFVTQKHFVRGIALSGLK